MVNRKGKLTFGTSWQADIPGKVSGKGRIRKTFTKKSEAQSYAQKTWDLFQAQGHSAFNLTDEQRLTAVKCFELLAPYPKLDLESVVRWALPRMRPTGGDKTVRELVDEVLKGKEARLKNGTFRARSMQTSKSRLNALADHFGKKLVAEVTGHDIFDWLNGKEGSGGGRRNLFIHARYTFEYAKQHGWCVENPCIGMPDEKRKILFADAEVETEAFTADEARKIMAHVPEKWIPFHALKFWAGLRASEALALTWECIHLDDKEPFIEIKIGVSKTKTRRLISIQPNLASWLRPYAQKSGNVAPDVQLYTHPFAAACKAAGVAPKHNGQRHGFVSARLAVTNDTAKTALESGHDPKILFGHYHKLTTHEEGERYFAIMPPAPAGNIVPLLAASA